MSYIGFGIVHSQQPFTIDEFTGDGTTTVFTLSTPKPIISRAIIVTIDGVVQDPGALNSYDLDANGDLEFSEPPENLASIRALHLGRKYDLAVAMDGSVTPVKMAPDANGDFHFDTDTLYIDYFNDRIGINTSTPQHALDVVGDIHASGNITADGNITLGDADTDSITFNADITSNILPDASSTYNLGSAGKTWLGVFADTFTGNLTGNVTGTVSDISNHTLNGLGDVNLAVAPTNGQSIIWDNATSKWIAGDSFNQSDFDSAIALKSIDVLSDVDTTTAAPTTGDALVWDGTNFAPQAPFSQSDFDSAFTAKDTDALSEGTTNLYYTDARVGAYISSDRTYGNITIESTDAGSAAGPDLVLYRNSASPASGDYIGQIQYVGENSNGGQEIYAKITGKITDETLGTEDGLIETAIKGNGSFTIVSRQRSDELQLINGVGLSVAGNTTLTGTLNSHTIPGGTGTVALTSDIPAPIPDTDSLSEGSTNLYYTQARADARVTAALATDVIIGGNLTVNGTTTTLNTATLDVEDLNITVASGAADAAAANGAGLTVAGANATITYDSTNDEWDLNKDINVTGSVRASQPFFTNSQTVTENHTVATGESAMAAGPVTVNSGVTVTVSSGSRWVIV